MNFLLDTHIILWMAARPDLLQKPIIPILENKNLTLFFSTVNIWEITIKTQLGRDNFKVNSELLCENLIENDLKELTISSKHALSLTKLPPLHRDPFDRMLIAQAISEDLILLTADQMIAQYDGPIWHFSS